MSNQSVCLSVCLSVCSRISSTYSSEFRGLKINSYLSVPLSSKAPVCSHLIAAIAISNPAEGKDVRLLRLLCVV